MRLISCLTTSAFCLAIASALPGRSPPPFVGPPTRDTRLAQGWVDEDAKYFRKYSIPTESNVQQANQFTDEPGNDDQLGHYDIRYFKGIVSYEERTATLSHMMRAYLNFFRERGLETWIAHGTLLGWWWNGHILPWDWDVDTQVSGDTLAYMARHLNQTKHQYAGKDTESTREYLLDVNSMSWERVRGDGMNIIDARWIDTKNGLYIDITGLSETDPQTSPGIISCKNLHHYQMRDMYPMRETTFEGVPTRVPYAYDKLLVEEYQEKALTLTEYEGHIWDSETKTWIKKPAPSPNKQKEPVNWIRKLRR
ncbi:hypothetical protein BT63DRAFT_176220 [Microthyrium microscopicum]|uniref:LicD/FKTN/FKRP nucleotidyltransferase domain-containing protein n=1 Tax=Microthyrium microscopicum TaxID=703497 RepID=A0A6A6UIW5_9PEZI|nr:hypothetical protein BT63DRAFT_176220 [Microthyrium microscopicum]